MKRLCNYLIISILLILSGSCGTDLDPQIFPNRTIADYYISVDNFDFKKMVFASDSKIYFYSSALNGLISYDISTRKTVEIPIQMADGSDESAESMLGFTLDYYCDPIINNEYCGAFWYDGKGYLVQGVSVYVFSPESSEWSLQNISAHLYADDSEFSNAVFINNEMVQISSSYLYRFSPQEMTWEREGITHYFRQLHGYYASTVLCKGSEDKLYAYDYYEQTLYMFVESTKLWQEIKFKQDLNLFGYVTDFWVNGNLVYFWNSSDNSDIGDKTLWEIDLSKNTNNAKIVSLAPEIYSLYFYSEFNMFNVGNTFYNICMGQLFEFKLK